MSTVDATFVSLADALRTPRGAIAPTSAETTLAGTSHDTLVFASAGPLMPASPERTSPDPIEAEHQPVPPTSPDLRSAVQAARIFRAALGDAFDVLLVDLMHGLSAEILARELQLGAAEITPIAQRLIAERFADDPVRLRVAPDDAAIACTLPVVADPTLAPGDAILECRTGTVDARLGVRLAQLLAELVA